MSFARARSLGETWALARAAGLRAGVTRLADITGMGGLDLPVFQAIRPMSRSLTVSQGKGGSLLAAKISAMLEAAEFAAAEALVRPHESSPLSAFPPEVRRLWSGERPALAIDLDPALPRAWVEGRCFDSGETRPIPWDLLSLDFTRAPLDYAASSSGLATGNTRDEALLAALAELIEHDLIAQFQALRPGDRRVLQIAATSIPDTRLASELHRVTARGFTPRLWSLGQAYGIAVVLCVLFPPEPMLDAMAPVRGSACHPDATTAALAALREAVQGRAALVAGARDDFRPQLYTNGRRQATSMALASLALGDGELPWSAVPSQACHTASDGANLLRAVIARRTELPVLVFDHDPPVTGLHLVHAMAPGLGNLSRRRRPEAGGGRPRDAIPVPPRLIRRPSVVLFGGPSIAGLALPPAFELRPPAVCGDLAALTADPPAVVGLVDGCFGVAPSVWHKEILHLLALGVRVLGAASIGALRAAELHAYGMEGVGAIHAAYRAGAIARDDAVMLLHAPGEYGFKPLTLPLVDAEYALNVVSCDAGARRMMQRIVRTTPYASRSWLGCLEAYRMRAGREFPVALTTLEGVPSLKRQDAALLVHALSSAIRSPGAPLRRVFPPATGPYLKLLARTRPDAPPNRGPETHAGPLPAGGIRSRSTA